MSWAKPRNDGVEVALAIPHRGEVSFDWATMLTSLELPPHTISSKTTAAIDFAREESVEEAMSNNPDWVLFLDSDTIPPRDVFTKLARHDLDVVSGVYMARKENPHPAAWILDDNDCLSPVARYQEGKIVNVDAVGLGCCLVHSRVLRDMERPWFRWTEGYEDHPWDMRNVGGPRGVSEDFYFCHKVQKAGYNIYMDTSVFCKHEDRCMITKEGRVATSEHRDGGE